MKSYHAKSWSVQARKMADGQFEEYLSGYCTKENIVDFFAHSYRAEIVRYRAAKRFGRKLRKENKNG